jgi:hypothetical protein
MFHAVASPHEGGAVEPDKGNVPYGTASATIFALLCTYECLGEKHRLQQELEGRAGKHDDEDDVRSSIEQVAVAPQGAALA